MSAMRRARPIIRVRSPGHVPVRSSAVPRIFVRGRVVRAGRTKQSADAEIVVANGFTIGDECLRIRRDTRLLHGLDRDARRNVSLERGVVGWSSWKVCLARAFLLENQRDRQLPKVAWVAMAPLV
jgi:hypothetical protein